MKRYPPGLIGLACGDICRVSDAITSIVGLQKPPGTKFKKHSGLGPAQPFNQIGLAFLDDPRLEWLFLTNDDNLCPADSIPRLLDHEKDVVSGLYLGRMMPFEPVLFDRVELRDGKRWYVRHYLRSGERGLVPAAAVGDGCLLIRRCVMEKLAYPWWEYGESLTDVCDHDVVFSRKVVEAGFGLWCDLDLIVDHVGQFAVRPHRDPETWAWTTHVAQDNEKIITVHAAVPPED